jgi:hypothetical protein
VTALRALVRKELAVLFASPVAWLTLAAIGLVTALLFFDHLRVYNQILFLFASSTMGGFESDTVPAYVNLRDQVFLPEMETLALTLVGLVPLVTMRRLRGARARHRWLLATTLLAEPDRRGQADRRLRLHRARARTRSCTATSIVRAGLGLPHLLAVAWDSSGSASRSRPWASCARRSPAAS